MVTLQIFERLLQVPSPTKSLQTRLGGAGENVEAWGFSLFHLSKDARLKEINATLGELLVCPLEPIMRLALLESIMPAIERAVGEFRLDYLAYDTCEADLVCQEQIHGVRSLYFLIILICKNALATLGETVIVKNAILGFGKPNKNRAVLLGYYMSMGALRNLLLKYALAHERVPRAVWGQLNRMYMSALSSNLVHMPAQNYVDDTLLAADSIHHYYLQCVLASFSNFFAYKRSDTVRIFDELPIWARHVQATMTPSSEHKVFVHLKGNRPPQIINKHLSINPYDPQNTCLFFDMGRLFDYLQVLAQEPDEFSGRIANMVLLAFDHNNAPSNLSNDTKSTGSLALGFGSVYHTLTRGRDFDDIIDRATTAPEHAPKTLPTDVSAHGEIFIAQLDDKDARFVIDPWNGGKDSVFTRTHLRVFGLFMIANTINPAKGAWRLGALTWIEEDGDALVCDGKLLGVPMAVCGVRLSGRDGRGQDFAPAILLDDGGVAKILLQKYHFANEDVVVLRIFEKQSRIKLGQMHNLGDGLELYAVSRVQ